MAPKISSKGNDKDVGDSKIEKKKAYWKMSNKKLFIGLVLKQTRLGNRPGKVFTVLWWDNIAKAFSEKASLHYEFLQFKELYG